MTLDIMGVGAVLTAFINISIYMRIKQKYEVFFESLGNFKNIYNFCEIITAHVVIDKCTQKHVYQVNYTFAIHICRYFIS